VGHAQAVAGQDKDHFGPRALDGADEAGLQQALDRGGLVEGAGDEPAAVLKDPDQPEFGVGHRFIGRRATPLVGRTRRLH
jgi:hypothetical protein